MGKGNRWGFVFLYALLAIGLLTGSTASAVTLFSDNFESGGFTAGGWINEGAQMQYTYKVSGLWAAEENATDKLTKAQSTAGYDTIVFTYWRYGRANTSLNKLYVEYTTNYGASWTALESPSGNFGWTYKAYALPSSCANNPLFGIRFRGAGVSASRWYIDDVTITGNQIPARYTLTTAVTGSGSISLNPTQPAEGYLAGTVVTATAWPGTGYKFNGWSGALGGLDNPQTITMTSNKSVTANFVSHPTNANTTKYWNYRNTLRSRYVIVAETQGGSNVVEYRMDPIGFIKWSDQTLSLGWYVGVLATEHYMLSNPQNYPDFNQGDSTRLTTCRNELYYALKALQRLDNNAEASFSPGWPNTPGFFIRDEVPSGFQSNFPGMSVMESDFTSSNIYNKEMSQDQVYHVMMGLAQVKHFIPAGTTINGFDLRQFAINEATNIVTHIKNGSWIIKNPVTGNDVARGPDTTAYCHGLNKVLVFITDGAVDYIGNISDTQKTLWNLMSDPANPAYTNEDNLHMAMATASSGNGWGNDTLDDMMSLGDLQDWWLYLYNYAALFRYVAQAQPNWAGHHQTIDNAATAMLALAPSTHEPRYPVDQTDVGTGWCAPNKFTDTISQQFNGRSGATYQTYSGLDYMLLHNLVYIVSPALY